MDLLRRYRLLLVAVVALIVGVGVGAVVASDDDREAPAAAMVTTTTVESSTSCDDALQLADEAMHASFQAMSLARLRADAPADGRGAPPASAVEEAAAQAEELRQQYERAKAECAADG